VFFFILHLFGVYSWHHFAVILADGVQACIAWLAFEKAEAWLETLPPSHIAQNRIYGTTAYSQDFSDGGAHLWRMRLRR